MSLPPPIFAAIRVKNGGEGLGMGMGNYKPWCAVQ